MFRTAINRPLQKSISFLPSKASRSEFISKFKLTPPPPGGVTGTISDNVPKPEPNWFEGSYHWDYERITAVSLVPLTMVPLYGALSSSSVTYPVLDAVLASSILIHSYLGLTSCIIDYIPKRKFGLWHKLAKYALAFGSSISLYGIYVLETENNGLVDLVGRLWEGEKNDSNAYVFGRF